MFDCFKPKPEKEKKPEIPITENVRSVLFVPLITGTDLNLSTVLSGEEDCFWSEKLNQKKALLFDSLDELNNYIKADEWQEKYSKTRAAIFFLGYSKESTPSLFDKGEFSTLVLRAIHLNDLKLGSVKPYENPLFNPKLIGTLTRSLNG